MGAASTIINRRPSKLAAAALEVARLELNKKVREMPLGSNDGPDVRKYLKSVGLEPGFAWCAAFVYWCTNTAAINAGIPHKLPHTGGVMAMFGQAVGRNIQKLDEKERFITPDDIRPGDIFILQFPGAHSHTGFVDKVSGDTIITIEGNTDAGGSREGIGVFSKRRKVSGLRGIIRITD